jgi:transmembrane sensor
MITKYDKIRQLYMERLAGMFDEEDEFRFQHILNTDKEAQSIVEELDKKQDNILIQDFINETDEKAELDKLKSRINKNKIVSYLKPSLAAAAAVCIVVFAILLYPRQNSISDTNDYITDNIASKGVSLKLSNGDSVELSTTGIHDTIIVGAVKIVTNGNILKEAKGDVSSTMNVLTVPAKEDYKIVLSDGTQVWLNSESKLSFPFKFSGPTREVVIEGEAYFEVAKDEEHPFVVRTRQTQIQVLGTKFNVNTYHQQQNTTSLLEGKVKLTNNNGNTISLSPGFEAQFVPNKGFVVEKFNHENVLSWRDGVYYLQNTPLGDLKPLISRWFEVDVVFDSPELKDYQITGLLEKGHLSDFLKDLATSANIEYHYSGSRLHIK